MTEYSGPFEDAGTGLTEAAWLNLEGNVYPYHGYIYGVLNELEVTETAPAAAMSVDVGTGAAIINSSRFQNNALQTKTIDSVTPGKNRIDSIVVRRTIAAVASTITIAVLKGSEAAPGAEAEPALTQVLTGVYELRIANILIASGTTAITTAMITDKRDSTDCGMFTPAVGPLAVDKATGNITTNGYDIDMSTSGQIHHLLDPTGDQDADTKKARADAITTALASFVPTGTFLHRSYLTAGSSYAAVSDGVKYFKVYVQGAGGNGGAATGSSYTGGDGGGSGGYLIKTFAGTSTSDIAYSIGAVGSNTTVTSTYATYTATCGSGATPGAGSGGDFNMSGQAGFTGLAAPIATLSISGAGGSSPFGYGGANLAGVSGATAGTTARGYGAGGGGALTVESTAARAGGAGMGGLVVIEEWG